MWSVFLGSGTYQTPSSLDSMCQIPCSMPSTEWNGAILILQYWVPEEHMPLWGWTIVFWVFFSILTTLGVVVYGEIEYYLGWFKILSLTLCFFLSILVNVGAFGNGYIGFKYWGRPTGTSLLQQTSRRASLV